MRPRSKKSRTDTAVYAAALDVVVARAEGRCEAGTPVCTGLHEHTHHRLPRSASSMSNPARHDPSRLLAVCLACHAHIHANPARSYARGWLIRRSAA